LASDNSVSTLHPLRLSMVSPAGRGCGRRCRRSHPERSRDCNAAGNAGTFRKVLQPPASSSFTVRGNGSGSSSTLVHPAMFRHVSACTDCRHCGGSMRRLLHLAMLSTSSVWESYSAANEQQCIHECLHSQCHAV
jgi:hypothetical protein